MYRSEVSNAAQRLAAHGTASATAVSTVRLCANPRLETRGSGQPGRSPPPQSHLRATDLTPQAQRLQKPAYPCPLWRQRSGRREGADVRGVLKVKVGCEPQAAAEPAAPALAPRSLRCQAWQEASCPPCRPGPHRGPAERPTFRRWLQPHLPALVWGTVYICPRRRPAPWGQALTVYVSSHFLLLQLLG